MFLPNLAMEFIIAWVHIICLLVVKDPDLLEIVPLNIIAFFSDDYLKCWQRCIVTNHSWLLLTHFT